MNILVILFTIFITIGGYILSRQIFNKYKHPLLNPVVLTTIMVITILLLFNLNFNDYKPGKNIMTFLLGPATVALAVPLYNNRQILRKGLLPIFTGIIIGSLTNIIVVVLVGKMFSFNETILKSLAPKSITAPIAIEVSQVIKGNPSLTAAFVVITGMIGSIIGPSLLNWLKVNDPVARGLSIGTTSHGQGTAVILEEGEPQGAMSGIAMAIAAIFTSFIVPFIVPILLKL